MPQAWSRDAEPITTAAAPEASAAPTLRSLRLKLSAVIAEMVRCAQSTGRRTDHPYLPLAGRNHSLSTIELALWQCPILGWKRDSRGIGEASPLALQVHPHMLRHACGFKLANDGQDTRTLQHHLGHRTFSTQCAIPS